MKNILLLSVLVILFIACKNTDYNDGYRKGYIDAEKKHNLLHEFTDIPQHTRDTTICITQEMHRYVYYIQLNYTDSNINMIFKYDYE